MPKYMDEAEREHEANVIERYSEIPAAAGFDISDMGGLTLMGLDAKVCDDPIVAERAWAWRKPSGSASYHSEESTLRVLRALDADELAALRGRIMNIPGWNA